MAMIMIKTRGLGGGRMAFDGSFIPRAMVSILSHTRQVLAAEAVLRVRAIAAVECGADRPDLRGVTAIASLALPVEMLVAFSFERALLEVIVGRVNAAVGAEDGQAALYYRETAAEIVNTVLALCFADFSDGEAAFSLSPPVVCEAASSIARPKNGVFASMRIRSDRGGIDVGVVGSRRLFDEHLDRCH